MSPSSFHPKQVPRPLHPSSSSVCEKNHQAGSHKWHCLIREVCSSRWIDWIWGPSTCQGYKESVHQSSTFLLVYILFCGLLSALHFQGWACVKMGGERHVHGGRWSTVWLCLHEDCQRSCELEQRVTEGEGMGTGDKENLIQSTLDVIQLLRFPPLHPAPHQNKKK